MKPHGVALTRVLVVALASLILLFVTISLLLAMHWPFTQQAVSDHLEHLSQSTVKIGRFDKTFFPHPGYVAEDIVITRNVAGVPPLVTLRALRCTGTWIALLTFTHNVEQVRAEGVRIFIPVHVPPPTHSKGKQGIATSVTDMIADGTVLEVASRPEGHSTLTFKFPHLEAKGLAANRAFSVRAVIQNPKPSATIATDLTFGPMKSGQVGKTPVSGSFRITDADLRASDNVAGRLTGHGNFRGALAEIKVHGTADVPNFEVIHSHHAVDLNAEYQATVDAQTGDVHLESANTHWLGSTLAAHGSIAGQSGEPGKVLSIDFETANTRVEDLLYLFVQSQRPPLMGPISFHAHVVLPPSGKPFLDRVCLDGQFNIHNAQFEHAETQSKVDELSRRARKGKHATVESEIPKDVLSDLAGTVAVRQAVAKFSEASLFVPGARAQMRGAYDLRSKEVDLYGKLAIQASLSRAAGGVKSIFLFPLNRFFKVPGAGAEVPIHITGTYSNPSFKVSLRPK